MLCGKGALERLLETHRMAKSGFSSKPITWTILAGPVLFWGQKTVPKRTQQLLAAGVDEEVMWNTHSALPSGLRRLSLARYNLRGSTTSPITLMKENQQEPP